MGEGNRSEPESQTIPKEINLDNAHFIFSGYPSNSLSLLRLPLRLGNVSVKALIATGAEVSAVSDILFAFIKPSLIKPSNRKNLELRSACNNNFNIYGRFSIPVEIKNVNSIVHDFYVITNLKEQCILGLDFIRRQGIIVNGSNNTIKITNMAQRPIIAGIEIGPTIEKDKKTLFNLQHLSEGKFAQFKKLFDNQKNLFAQSMVKLGCAHKHKHFIETNGPPVYTHPYKLPITQCPILQRYLTEMLENGIIRPSQSPYSSPVVLVKKKSGELRLCIDYRRLNTATVKDRYPLPRIDDIFDRLFGAQLFSTLDLFSGFWQINVNEKE